MTPLARFLDALALLLMVGMFAVLFVLAGALDGDAWHYLPEVKR